MFVRNCDTTKHQYNPNLLGSSDCLIGSRGNPVVNLSNLDFFSVLTTTPEDWPGLLAHKQELQDELIADDEYDPLDPSQRRLESRLRKNLSKNYMNYKGYDPFKASDRLQHKSGKRKAPPITYNDDDLFVAFPMNPQHADHHHVKLRPRRPPKFISCTNGTLFRVLSHNNSQKILDTSRKDLENILILQGQFCSKRLRQMSKVFTHNT